MNEHNHEHVPEGYALTSCPYCKITGIAKRPKPHPDIGAVMCDSCGEWVTWDDEAGALGKPTPEHLATLADSDHARKIRHVWIERRAAARAGTDYIEGLFDVFWKESFIGEKPAATADDGFQMRLSFYSGMLAVVELLGEPSIPQQRKAESIFRMRGELAAFFEYADTRQPSDETH